MAEIRQEGARSALQDYVRMYHALTAEVWEHLNATEAIATRGEALFEHIYGLGLRNPSESTYGVMTVLLSLEALGGGRSSFQWNSTYQIVKRMWKNFTQKREKDDPWAAQERPLTLGILQNLPLVAQRVFQDSPPVPTVVSEDTILRHADLIPKRRTNSAMPKQPALAHGGTGCAPWMSPWDLNAAVVMANMFDLGGNLRLGNQQGFLNQQGHRAQPVQAPNAQPLQAPNVEIQYMSPGQRGGFTPGIGRGRLPLQDGGQDSPGQKLLANKEQTQKVESASKDAAKEGVEAKAKHGKRSFEDLRQELQDSLETKKKKML